MGSIFLGIPEELAERIALKYKLKSFIETGTYKGGTARWASPIFEQVFTVEGSKELYELSKINLNALGNVRLIHSDSRKVLPDIIKSSPAPRMFWLDAHYTGGLDSYGEVEQCPLIEEILSISPEKENNWILIDDARLFLAPPVNDYDIGQWPTLHNIMETLEKVQGSREIIVWNDVIISPPEEHFRDLREIVSKMQAKKPQDRRTLIKGIQKNTIALIKYKKS